MTLGVVSFKLTRSAPQKVAQTSQNQPSKRGPQTNLTAPAQSGRANTPSKSALGNTPKPSLPGKPTPPPVSNACKVQSSSTKTFMTALKAENALHAQFKSSDKAAKESENKRHQTAIVAIMNGYRTKTEAAGKCI